MDPPHGPLDVPGVSLGHTNTLAMSGRRPGELCGHKSPNTKNGKKRKKSYKKQEKTEFFGFFQEKMIGFLYIKKKKLYIMFTNNNPGT